MITYKVGNLFHNLAFNTFLLHIVNPLGVTGGGFTAPLNRQFPQNKAAYLKWAADYRNNIPQGKVLAITENDITIFNCVAQVGLVSKENPKPFRPDSLEKCFNWILNDLNLNNIDNPQIVMPRIGTKLGGANWVQDVEPIINKYFADISVTVFTLPNEAKEFGIKAGTKAKFYDIEVELVDLFDDGTAEVIDIYKEGRPLMTVNSSALEFFL